MNAAEIHLMLNHLPMLGAGFGLLLLAYGMLRRQPDVVRASLIVLVLTGIAAVVVYLTGEPAEEVVEAYGGISEAAIEPHEEAALFAMIAAAVLGLLSAVVLLVFRGRTPGRAASTLVLIAALVTTGLMSWTGFLGGAIRHPEARIAVEISPAENPPEPSGEDAH